MYLSWPQEGIHHPELRPIWKGTFQECVFRLLHELTMLRLIWSETYSGLGRNEADPAADQGAIGIVEMLFCTSLVALVGAAENQPSNSPRKLQIVNTKVRAGPAFPIGCFSLSTRKQNGANEAAPVHHLRAHIPHLRPLGQDEPETSYCGAGDGDLHLRYLHNEAVTYH